MKNIHGGYENNNLKRENEIEKKVKKNLERISPEIRLKGPVRCRLRTLRMEKRKKKDGTQCFLLFLVIFANSKSRRKCIETMTFSSFDSCFTCWPDCNFWVYTILACKVMSDTWSDALFAPMVFFLRPPTDWLTNFLSIWP